MAATAGEDPVSSARSGPVDHPGEAARLAPRERPAGSPVLYQSWQQLLFLHWSVDPEELSQHLPEGVHLDTYEGKAWLGIVPFFMRNVRPRFLPPVPGLSNFLELNVRTYAFDDDGVPGVWFFSLDANNRLACAIARARFHLPYRDARMSAKSDEWLHYSTERHGESEAAYYRYRGKGTSRLAEPGSFEFFLLERYVLFAHDKKRGSLWRGRVHHEPYEYCDAEVEDFSVAPIAWDGLSVPAGPAEHACLSSGVDVSVFALEPVTSSSR